MATQSLEAVARSFEVEAERLHDSFVKMRSDTGCSNCAAAAFGEAILTAWIQTAWGEFTRHLTVASTLGGQKRDGALVAPAGTVATLQAAEEAVKEAARRVAEKQGLAFPVWHSPTFVVDIGTELGLDNLQAIQFAMGSTPAPNQITTLRNVLVQPGKRTQDKYEELQAKLGMLNIAPEYMPRQLLNPGLPLFTWWIRELQSAAYDSVN